MACFFGFGSLVNIGTHKYVAITPAVVDGWARAWINNDVYEHAFLSVIPDAQSSIHGLMAGVPADDWAELDIREAGYKRLALLDRDWRRVVSRKNAAGAEHAESGMGDVQMYQHASGVFATHGKPILWSYLETVLYGYHQWFGDEGVHEFIRTTKEWVFIEDDRLSPLYPRYVPAEGDAIDVVIPAIQALME